MVNQMHFNTEQVTPVGTEWIVQRVLAAWRGVSQRRSTGEADSTPSTAVPRATSASSVSLGVLSWIIFVFTNLFVWIFHILMSFLWACFISVK